MENSKEKQISDMQNLLWCRVRFLDSDESVQIAEALYNGGYRKASDVAEEIIEIAKSGAEKYINDITLHEGIRNMLSVMLDDFVAELKKKYTEEKLK